MLELEDGAGEAGEVEPNQLENMTERSKEGVREVASVRGGFAFS